MGNVYWRAYYNAIQQRVHIEFAGVRAGSNNVPKDTSLFTVPTKYRPTNEVVMPVLATGTQSTVGNGTISVNGAFRQSASSNCRAIYVVVDYIIL